MEVIIRHSTSEEAFIVDEEDDLASFKDKVKYTYGIKRPIELYHNGIPIDDIKAIQNDTTLTLGCRYQEVLDELEHRGLKQPIYSSYNTHNIEIVRLLLEIIDPSKDRNAAIASAVRFNHIDIIKLLLNDFRVESTVKYGYLLKIACVYGHIDIVKFLSQGYRVNLSTTNNIAIKMASESGRIDTVKFLLDDKRVDPSADRNYAIRKASEGGHLEVVKLLLADHRVDPSDRNNYAIRLSSWNGHTGVVKLLLSDSRVDPSAKNNHALEMSIFHMHVDVVKLLIKDPRVDASNFDDSIRRISGLFGVLGQ